MAGIGDMLQKAFYMGVGLASYAGEKAGDKLVELRVQAQKLADEMVARGEMNAEEARRFVEDMMGQYAPKSPKDAPRPDNPPKEPRRIEILDDDEDSTTTTPSGDVEDLQTQVRDLQEELHRLQRE